MKLDPGGLLSLFGVRVGADHAVVFVMVAYESILDVQLLAGTLILISLFTAYRSRDPLVCAVLSVSLLKPGLIGCPGCQFNSIPTVGFAYPILSYLSAFYFDFFDATTVIKQGYEKVTSSE